MYTTFRPRLGGSLWLSLFPCSASSPHHAPIAQSSSWLDDYRAGRPVDRRVAVESVRVGTPGAARRHLRSPPERIRGARECHQVGRGGNEERWARQRPRRARKSAPLGARAGERRDHLAASIGAGDARSRQQRRHARRWHRSRRARGSLVCRARRARARRSRQDRALQRPVHDLRRNRPIPRRRSVTCGQRLAPSPC